MATFLSKTASEIKTTVLTNVLKMLNARGQIKDLNKALQDVPNQNIGENIYKIPTKDGHTYVKISNQMATSTGRTTDIGTFLIKYKSHHNILIVPNNSQNKKIRNIINKKYKNVELFEEVEFMINLIDHDLVPKHEILNETDKKVFAFEIENEQLNKVYVSDPVARYYRAQVGDVFRITRPSDMGCPSIAYSQVVLD